MKIGLISDTHSHMDADILRYLAPCDQIWHAGDVGDASVLDQLEAVAPVRAVYGNIDDPAMQRRLPLNWTEEVEGVRVLMTHIGGYPGRYSKRVRELLDAAPCDLYICGHSHILKIMPDKKRRLLHINPGACGHQGFHLMRTMVRFQLMEGRIEQVEVIELGRRGR